MNTVHFYLLPWKRRVAHSLVFYTNSLTDKTFKINYDKSLSPLEVTRRTFPTMSWSLSLTSTLSAESPCDCKPSLLYYRWT